MKKGAACILILALIFLSPGNSAAKLLTGEFADARGHWAEAEIQTAWNNGLLSGVGINEEGVKIFSPDSHVSRAQLSVVLNKTFALDYGQLRFVKAPQASDYFWDVNNDEWYADAAMLCAINDIYEAGRELAPDDAVSRIEVARSIYRAFAAKNISVPMIMLMPYYSDAAGLSQEEINAIVFVSNTSIMKGNDELFRPYDQLTRAELARVVNRCASIIKDNPPETKISQSFDIYCEEIQSADDLLEVDVNLPVITEMKDLKIQNSINQLFKQEVEALKDELYTGAAEHKKNAEEMDFPFHRYQLYTRSGPYFENGKLLSMYVDYYFYSGGAHGLTDRRSYNYDLDSGDILKLKDLFVPGFEYKEMIDEAIAAEINKRPGDFFADEYGFQGIGEEQNYYLQNDTLVIYFNQYEIAPYAAGIQEFRIPLQIFCQGLIAEFKL